MAVVLRGRVDKGLPIIHRVGCMPTFYIQEANMGAFGNALTLYGVAVADVEGRTRSAGDSAAAKAI